MRRLRASVIGGRCGNCPAKLSKIYRYLGDRPITVDNYRSAQDLSVKHKVVVKSIFKRDKNRSSVRAGICCNICSARNVGQIEESSQSVVKTEKLYLLFISVINHTVSVIL